MLRGFLHHFKIILFIADDVTIFIRQRVFFQNCPDSFAPSAVGLEICDDLWLVGLHEVGRENLLFKPLDKVYIIFCSSGEMTAELDVREAYKRLKFKLPDYDALDDDFEISFIDYKLKDDKMLMRMLRRKVDDKVIFFCRVIEGLLYPHQGNITGMMELNRLTDEDKKKIYEFYKQLMQLERESLKLDVQPDDKKNAEFINKVFGAWKAFKQEMYRIVEKMQAAWHAKEKEEGETYLG